MKVLAPSTLPANSM